MSDEYLQNIETLSRVISIVKHSTEEAKRIRAGELTPVASLLNTPGVKEAIVYLGDTDSSRSSHEFLLSGFILGARLAYDDARIKSMLGQNII